MDGSTKPEERTAVVFAGGDPVDPHRLPPLPHNALLIAADGGLAQAVRLGLTVDVVVGDMDSVDAEALATAIAAGATEERHPIDKDATDLELALDFATGRGCTRVVVVGGLGGRLDHLLANALLLVSGPSDGVRVEWWTESAHLSPVRPGPPLECESRPGDLVSLIPIGGPASGVTTTGLRWSLDGDILPSGSTRGISNEATAEGFSVTVDRGALLVVHHNTEVL